jgi:hypothetical protein
MLETAIIGGGLSGVALLYPALAFECFRHDTRAKMIAVARQIYDDDLGPRKGLLEETLYFRSDHCHCCRSRCHDGSYARSKPTKQMVNTQP